MKKLSLVLLVAALFAFFVNKPVHAGQHEENICGVYSGAINVTIELLQYADDPVILTPHVLNFVEADAVQKGVWTEVKPATVDMIRRITGRLQAYGRLRPSEIHTFIAQENSRCRRSYGLEPW